MEHAHDRAHTQDHVGADAMMNAISDAMRAPGRSTKSALLRKPEHPVSSGLLAGAATRKGNASRVDDPTAQVATGGQTGRAASEVNTPQDQQKHGESASESALERFFREHSDLVIPGGCTEAQRWLAGAYFPGTVSNAERFIGTQSKDQRGELEDRLQRLRNVWNSAGHVRGAQTNLKQLWQAWHRDWHKSHIPVRLNKITESDCVSVLQQLRADHPNRTDYKGRPWKAHLNRSGGICATGVHYIFKKLTGLSISGNGKDWEDRMDSAIRTGEIPYRRKEDLNYNALPSGSVIVWGPGKPPYGTIYGHVCVTVDDLWFSDYQSKAGGQGGAHVLKAIFVPNTPLE